MPRFLVINYSADISGSTVALLKLLNNLPTNDFHLIASPNSYAAEYAKEKQWTLSQIEVPRLFKTLSPIYWCKYLLNRKKLSHQLTHLITTTNPNYLLINCSVNLGWLKGYHSISKSKRPQLLWFVHELEGRPQWVFNLIYKKLERDADQILCVSKPVQQLFSHNTYLFPNALSLPPSKPLLNPFKQKTLRLLWVGTVSPRKGLHLLADVIEHFKTLSTPIELKIIATVTSNFKDYFHSSLAKLKQHSISYKTLIDVKEMETVYDSSHILIHTSTLPESFNRVALEAMSHGMLVFSGNQGGIQDYGVHKQNLIFFEKIAEPLPLFIKKLSENNLLVESIQSNALKTSKGFSEEKIYERFEEILNKPNT